GVRCRQQQLGDLVGRGSTGRPDADSNAHAVTVTDASPDGHTDTNADSDRQSYTHPETYSDANAIAYSHAVTVTDTNADAIAAAHAVTVPDSLTNTFAHPDLYSNANARADRDTHSLAHDRRDHAPKRHGWRLLSRVAGT